MDGQQQATASLDQPPPAPPSDPEKQKCIDQVVKYVAEEGCEAEGKFRESQFGNPAFSFLFGGEGEDYYMYKLCLAGGSPQPFKEVNQAHRFPELSCDVASEMNDVLNGLKGTKESIESAKTWFMKRCTFAPSLAEAFRDKLFELDNDPERQWHILYLVNDILIDSLQNRVKPKEIDDVALAFRPLLMSMLERINNHPRNKNDKQSTLSELHKILKSWGSKEVYDEDIIGFYSMLLSFRPLAYYPVSVAPQNASVDELVKEVEELRQENAYLKSGHNASVSELLKVYEVRQENASLKSGANLFEPQVPKRRKTTSDVSQD